MPRQGRVRLFLGGEQLPGVALGVRGGRAVVARAAAPAFLGTVAALAARIPARRGARVNLVEALRSD